MAEQHTSGKGKFGRAGLPVSLAYLLPGRRNRPLLLAAGAALFGLIVVVANFQFQAGHLVSSGPLSAAHATLDTKCASCHVAFRAVPTSKCAACHERLPARDSAYSFAAHYVYKSGDHTRAFSREGEMACAACHVEHRGRVARPTAVSDERCVTCHAYAPFDVKHPQFSFVAQGASDADALRFAHIKHLERVLDDMKSGDVEAACLVCHRPAADGLGFEPIQFERSCTTCHLGPDIASVDLDVVPSAALVRRSAGRIELRLGVETLDMIRRRLGPDDQWALSANPTQFEVNGSGVVKHGIVHKDPWITQSLRNLRHILYPSQELADLLVASADVAPRNRRVLYDEALRTLKEYAAGLQGRPQPWLQQDLAEITQAIAEVQRRIDDPTTPLSAAKFRLDYAPDPELTPDQVQEVNTFAETIAKPCLVCHRLQNATIVRPEADQRVLRRAEFNHRAHVIQRGCLDCHTAIPVAEYLDTGRKVDASVDRAAIQNIPKIEVCRECHTPSKASTQCRTCHVFHPASDRRAGFARAIH